MPAKEPPNCFGKYWEESNAECCGGLDPLYIDSETDTNKRPPCAWFRSCESAYVMNGQQMSQPLIPPQHLIRQPFVAPAPQPPPPPWRSMEATMKAMAAVAPVPALPPLRPAPPPPVFPQHQAQQVMQHPTYPVPLVPPPQAVMPHYVPMNYTMPGAQVPSFLTVPEPPGQSWKARLIFSLLRGIAKSVGLVLANFFDHTPITPWNPPPPPPDPPH